MHSLFVTCQVSICFASLHILNVDPHTISFLPFFTGSHETLLYDYINFTCLCCFSLKMITWTKCSHVLLSKMSTGTAPPSQSPICFSRFVCVLACWMHKVTLPVCHTPCHGRAASMLSPGKEGIPFAQGKQH